jgi:hypothetical protein
MFGIIVISRHEEHDMIMDGAWPQIINVTLYNSNVSNKYHVQESKLDKTMLYLQIALSLLPIFAMPHKY